MELRRCLAAGAAIGLLLTITPAAVGLQAVDIGALAPNTGTFMWGTGYGRGPVKCAESDVTPDGRVFPEPQVSGTFLTFSDFQCGITLLEELYPDRIEVKKLGKSA